MPTLLNCFLNIRKAIVKTLELSFCNKEHDLRVYKAIETACIFEGLAGDFIEMLERVCAIKYHHVSQIDYQMA